MYAVDLNSWEKGQDKSNNRPEDLEWAVLEKGELLQFLLLLSPLPPPRPRPL